MVTVEQLKELGDIYAVNNGDSTDFISTDPQKVLEFVGDCKHLWIDVARSDDGVVVGGFGPEDFE